MLIRTITTAVIALAGCVALVLSGCGGGGCNPCEGADVPTPRIDCKARPEQCK